MVPIKNRCSSLKSVGSPLPPWRVLVFPGGTEIGLEINRALRDCKEVELFAAGQKVPSASEFRFRRQLYLPSITDPAWLKSLNSLIEENGIDFVYPAHDDVVLALARHRDDITAIAPGSPLEVCEIARAKSLTYRHLQDHVPVPKVFVGRESPEFPVFVKPDRGQGSQEAVRIDDADALQRSLRSNTRLIVSELLPGDEYTIDCFSSARRGLIFAQARVRTRTRSGIAMQTSFVRDEEFHRHAHAIAAAMPLRGAWFFQMKRDRHGQLKLLEVAPRIAGAMALSRAIGLNLPLMTLYDAAGFDVQPITFDADIELSRSLDNHYSLSFTYSSVYVDLDDTLIVRGQVNTRLVQFLYQAINEGKSVNLVTRHRENLGKTLERYRLSGIFDRIHHLDDDRCKSTVIGEEDAILIDDSFRERLLVSRALGIRTFDPAAVECLIDARA